MTDSSRRNWDSGMGMGVFLVNLGTHEVLQFSDEMRSICPKIRVGAKCFEAYDESAPCTFCPLGRLKMDSLTVGKRRDPRFGADLDIVAVRLGGGPTALVCYGHISLLEKRRWIEDRRYQNILRQTRTIAFEYDLGTEECFISPHVGEILAGNYDGRLLGEVFLSEEVVYPADAAAFRRYRDTMLAGIEGAEITARLRCRDGSFRWFKTCSAPCEDEVDGRRLLVGTIVDVDEEVSLRESLRRRAEYDATTGIYNRSTFYRNTRELLAANPGKRYNLIRFDINRFKSVNELFGVSEGDRALRHVGQVVESLARGGETFGHMGNDVFCMCVDRTDADTVALIGEINDRINDYKVDFNFILSCGVFTVERYEGEPVSLLCDRAALAQRSIKGNYVRRCAFYEDRMGRALSKEHYIIGSMRRAMEQGQFLIYLQPKVDMRTGALFGAEALARWKHPQDGLISPGEFVPIFERNGFIVKLDEYIWELTCKTLRGWIDRKIQPVPVSINVSRTHLYDLTLCDKIVALIKKYDLPPQLLELEITESAYAENPQSLYAMMEQLQAKGFTFSMDDFGSGYSSLNMLKDIPVDILKIDLNFLKPSRRGERAGRAILEATIGMAQKLDLPVIAEGVETSEQAHVLMEAGCTRAQGYLYARPMPCEEFEELLVSRQEAQ